ncbi:MAG: general secretion pathway protein GspF [Halobacteria archaeon]|nr:general secretion pathway protein GspF [Halobacteria archaeon]
MGERARSAEEYAALVDQAIFDLKELRASTDYDIEAIDTNTAYLGVLLEELRELRASMADGSYLFGRNDLPFMRIVKQHSERELPFIRLLYQINATHRQGLDV